jgi:hypothetical protein
VRILEDFNRRHSLDWTEFSLNYRRWRGGAPGFRKNSPASRHILEAVGNRMVSTAFEYQDGYDRLLLAAHQAGCPLPEHKAPSWFDKAREDRKTRGLARFKAEEFVFAMV